MTSREGYKEVIRLQTECASRPTHYTVYLLDTMRNRETGIAPRIKRERHSSGADVAGIAQNILWQLSQKPCVLLTMGGQESLRPNGGNTMKRTLITLTAAVLMTSGLAFAQQTDPHDKATVNQRRENQQDRIAQGVRSGQLTARETGRLESREARVNHEIRADRRVHNGHLTAPERRQVNRQQNRISKSIYRDKHNGHRQ